MATLRIAAPAKINLFLHVTGKRPDGYHLLESLVTFAEFGDVLEIYPAETLTLEMAGPFAHLLQQNEDNIVMKASQLLKAHTKCKAGAHIKLEKHIPVGAGLGGGSADAAAALVGLKKLWNLEIDNKAMLGLALQLGSDVPVCLARRTAWVGGTGEQVTPVDIKADVWAVLVNPGVPLLTKDVFQHFSSKFASPSEMPEAIDSFDALVRSIQAKHNALEAPAITLLPVIGDVLAATRATKGCRLSRMSGSGATCFGLYDNETDAQKAAVEIKSRYPSWWNVVTKLAAS